MRNNKNTPEQGLTAQNNVGETSERSIKAQVVCIIKKIPLLPFLLIVLGVLYAKSDLPFVGDLYEKGAGLNELIKFLYFNDSVSDIVIGVIIKTCLAFFLFIPLLTTMRLLNCMSETFLTSNSHRWVVQFFNFFSKKKPIYFLLSFARKIDNGEDKSWGFFGKMVAWVYRKKCKTGYSSLMVLVAFVFAVIFKWKVATGSGWDTMWGDFSLALGLALIIIGFISKGFEGNFQKAKVELKDQTKGFWCLNFMFALSILAAIISTLLFILGLIDFIKGIPAMVDFFLK
ncbi:hypothetical protein [Vibrio alginolyticus]|uniref:hypothetical protein n=1 Tax=Vibrio alginolyticus TaxID=663 RepID=UPI0006CA6EEB|nr:hypothetical protein [Vibrio alginolyticus]KPM97493.1 hypothetical protein AOG25_13555 [Vibrio alginolyticus]CAH7189758.1 conserved membrane hypothetical protein [Vibrio chagasii]CAH7358254.1 conserved membrane hypothetical protein [Vibrio chagasii]